MNRLSKHKLPWWAIACDAIGTALLGVGLLLRFGVEILPILLPYDLADSAMAMIVVGLLLMAPLIIVVVRRAA